MLNSVNRPALPEHDSQLRQGNIFFCHIPKCAGTAITLRLEPAFDQPCIFLSRTGLNGRNLHDLNDAERRQFLLVGGHITESVRGEFFPQFQGVVGIRNPLQRFHSLYKHAARSEKFDPILHQLSVTQDPAFFDRPDVIEAFQTRISSLFYLQDLATRQMGDRATIAQRLESALQTLDRYAFVYTDETIDAAASELAYALGQPPLTILPKANEATLYRQDFADFPFDAADILQRYFPYELAIFERAQQRAQQCLQASVSESQKRAAYEANWRTLQQRTADFTFDTSRAYCGTNWGWRTPGPFEPYLNQTSLRLNGRSGFLDLPFDEQARQLDLVFWTNNRPALRTAIIHANGVPCETTVSQDGRFTRFQAPLSAEHIGDPYTRLNVELTCPPETEVSVFLYDLKTSAVETCSKPVRRLDAPPRASRVVPAPNASTSVPTTDKTSHQTH